MGGSHGLGPACRCLAFALLMVPGSTCWGQDAVPPAPPPPSGGEQSQAAPLAVSPKEADANYAIGAEDILDIDVFGLPELAKTVRVANDGTIVLALLGRVQAAGLTLDEFRSAIETKYAKTYLQNPQVSVYVREFHSRPVSVFGSVDKPGVFQLSGNQTLIDMLSLAGGFSKGGAPAGQSAYVTRRGGFGSMRLPEGMRQISADKIEINLTRLFYSRDESLNIPIKPFDIITVNQADRFYVIGGVKQANSFAFPPKDAVTVLQAVAMAGGLTPTAAKGKARIIRTKEDGSRIEIPVELGKIIKEQAPDVQLAANDILYIADNTTKAAAKRSLETLIQTASGVTIYRGW